MSLITNRSVLARYVVCPGCGKRGYEQKAYAKAARQSLGGHGLHVYRCPQSGAWHVGHQRTGITRDYYRQRAA